MRAWKLGMGCVLMNATLMPVAHAEDIRFPADLGAVNARQAGAKGDGKTDDTKSLQKALDQAGRGGLLYIPNGTYLVSDKLVFSKNLNDCRVVQGQSQAGTIIKLADHSAGYDNANQRKSVVATFEGQSNSQFNNSLYNLTIDVGAGNPDAVALQHMSHNQGGVYDVTLRSSDPQERGAVRLDLTYPWLGPSIYKRLTVEGFDLGIDIAHSTYSQVYEHLRLKNQRVAGVRNTENILSLRDLQSDQSRTHAPVFRITQSGAMLTLLNSELSGGVAPNAAPDAAIENKA